MKESVRRSTLIGSCVVASLVIVAAIVEVPQVLRVAPGIALVLVLPGFVALSMAGQAPKLPFIELALASLGISVATATCVATLLASTPIGLGRASFGIVLGGITLIGSIIALAKV